MVAIVRDSRAVRPASVGELAGATLGPYRLEALLGHGNRAAVYRAVDAQGGRAVALRVPALPPAGALGLLGPVADALDQAHRRALVHGALKPGAILLRGPGDPALADLGLAQLLPRENRLLLAAQGRHYGTAEYLAPEQAEGVPAEARTDVYALGVVLYEMLTGRPPFRAEGPGDTPRAVAARHLTAAPPAPRSLNPALGEAVEGALLRALAKAPGARFP